MVYLAVREGNLTLADSLFEVWEAIGSMALRARAPFAYLRRDSVRLASFVAQAESATGRGPALGARDLAALFRDYSTAERIARLSVSGPKAPGVRATGHVVLAELEAGRGRWRSAVREVEAARSLDPEEAGELRAFCHTLPFFPIPAVEVRTALEQLAEPSEVASAPGLAGALAPHVRLYQLGLLHARLGRDTDAERIAAEVERLPAPAVAQAAVRSLAHTIRADVAMRRGRHAEALAELEQVRGEVPSELLDSPVLAQAHARYLRGEALSRLGRPDEALRWYAHGFDVTPAELYYMAPTHLRRGEIYDQLGDRESAARHYAIFLELWDQPEPELVTEVERVRARLGELLAEKPETP